MAKQSKLLTARNELKSRCKNYFDSLYDEKAFANFRSYAEKEMHNIETDRKEKIEDDQTRMEGFKKHPKTIKELYKKVETIKKYLEQPNNITLVEMCLAIDSNGRSKYIPEEYAVTNGGISELESVLLQLKSLKRLLDCFAPNPKENIIEITPELAKQQIENFAKTFSEEKRRFKFDTKGQKFLEAIGHILASALTLGGYAALRAGYSYHKRNSPKFWKSEPELIESDLDNALKETKNIV